MHAHGKPSGTMQRILKFSLVLTALYIAATLFFGLRAHSLALISEAGHNVSDFLALALSFVDVQATIVAGGVDIRATAATTAGTGVEMEAMVAASIAALTIYDMTKALDKGIRIREVVLLSKTGGKSGDYRRTPADSRQSG